MADSIGPGLRQHVATVWVAARQEEVTELLRWADHGPIEGGEEGCMVEIRGEDLGLLAMTIARVALAAPVTVKEPAELVALVSTLAAHLTPSSS